MIFTTNEICTGQVEINTMYELQAYALGGTGKIEIDFQNRHPIRGTITYPRIKKIEEKE